MKRVDDDGVPEVLVLFVALSFELLADWSVGAVADEAAAGSAVSLLDLDCDACLFTGRGGRTGPEGFAPADCAPCPLVVAASLGADAT